VKRLRFVIGRAFPPDDPIARFVTVLAQAHNDFVRIFERLSNANPGSQDAEDQAIRILGLRLNAASHAEASAFLRDALRRWPSIKQFMDGLGDDLQNDVEHVAGVTDPRSEHYLEWLQAHRNVTFHYAEVHSVEGRTRKRRDSNRPSASKRERWDDHRPWSLWRRPVRVR
jgi:hypothetical protein